MRRDGQAVNLSNLTPGETAILDLIRSQPGGGVGLLSRAWFGFCVRHRDEEARPGFPTSERVVSRDLGRLVKWKILTRVVAPDHGAWYCLPEVWEAMTPLAQTEVRSYSMMARGSKNLISLLVPGPAGIGPPYRDRIWAVFTVNGQTRYRGVPFKNIRHPETGTLHPFAFPVADPGIRLFSFAFTTEFTGRPLRFKYEG
jgi:hypothetical protein